MELVFLLCFVAPEHGGVQMYFMHSKNSSMRQKMQAAILRINRGLDLGHNNYRNRPELY